jgi:glycylpeptide N-tetradecanoyltransferase
MELFGLRNALPRNAPKNEQELLNKQEWKFWSTQPVKALGEKVNCGVNEAIDPTKKPEDIKKDSYALPDGFHWDDLDLTDVNQVRQQQAYAYATLIALVNIYFVKKLKELYVLLNENYVEDDDNMFRFDYSPNFLQW